jgi:magnesium transporter
MIRVLLKGDCELRDLVAGPGFVLPSEAVWIDLLNPTRDEELACEAALGASLPTREEMAEIETSSRLYKEGPATVMTAAVLANSDTPTPVEGPVTFVLVGSRLATIRYIEPKAFAYLAHQIHREPNICASGTTVFVALIEALVDRLADVLERSSAEVEALSADIFRTTEGVNYRPVMKRLGRIQNVNAKVRDSLTSLARLTGFAMLIDTDDHQRDYKGHLKSVQRDVASLTEHSGSLSANIAFMLEATLGLINVEQNAIIKFFSVAAVIFLPPTLVASYFGMNFKHMRWFDMPHGEALAFGMMILAVFVPLLWFKRRGWL